MSIVDDKNYFKNYIIFINPYFSCSSNILTIDDDNLLMTLHHEKSFLFAKITTDSCKHVIFIYMLCQLFDCKDNLVRTEQKNNSG